MAQLRILIPQLLEIMPNTRIIIDGLDECATESQRAVLKDLQTLCLGPERRCRLLISSRRDVTISERLSQKPQILLDGRGEVDTDIRSFVKYKIAPLRTSDKELLKRIETILVEKANGMFMFNAQSVVEHKLTWDRNVFMGEIGSRRASICIQ
jgi:hypothetical protein